MKKSMILIVLIISVSFSLILAEEKVIVAKTFDIKAPKTYKNGFSAQSCDGLVSKSLRINGLGYMKKGKSEWIAGNLSATGKMRQVSTDTSYITHRGQLYDYAIDILGVGGGKLAPLVKVYNKQGKRIAWFTPFEFPETMSGYENWGYSLGVGFGPKTVAIVANRVLEKISSGKLESIYSTTYFNEISHDGSSVGTPTVLFDYSNAQDTFAIAGDPVMGTRNSWIIPIAKGNLVKDNKMRSYETNFYTGIIKSGPVKPAAVKVKLNLIYKSKTTTGMPWATIYSIAHKSGFYFVQTYPFGEESVIHYIKSTGKRAQKSVHYPLYEWLDPEIKVKGKIVELQDISAELLQPVLEPGGNLLLPRLIKASTKVTDEISPGKKAKHIDFGRADVHRFNVKKRTFSLIAKTKPDQLPYNDFHPQSFGHFAGGDYWIIASYSNPSYTAASSTVTVFKGLIK